MISSTIIGRSNILALSPGLLTEQSGDHAHPRRLASLTLGVHADTQL